MRNYFETLAASVQKKLHGNEEFRLSFSAESSDFIRFNKSKIRQPGHVKQVDINLDLISGKKHLPTSLTLSGNIKVDESILQDKIEAIRNVLPHLKEDPYLLINTTPKQTESIKKNELPSPTDTCGDILGSFTNLDFVGIHASGGIYRGFASSYKQNYWHERYAFNLDYSLYHEADKAVKNNYAGEAWNTTEFEAKKTESLQALNVIKRPAKNLEPGQYRAYLAPAAVAEILGLMSWGGFSEKSKQAKASPFQHLCDKRNQLGEIVTISENTAGGLGPNFQAEGFLKPGAVSLIENGHLKGCLVSPRTELEYKVQNNGSDDGESPKALSMQPGTLEKDAILSRLNNGICINNLWYLNFSDKLAGRMTGMTRFATFWVENGEIVAPTNVMRFDDSIYHILGSNLEALTNTQDYQIDPQTYGSRSTDTWKLPGALLKSINFTL